MKILLLQNMLYVPGLGGANKATRCLAAALQEHGHETRVLAKALGTYGPSSREQFVQSLAARRFVIKDQDEDYCGFVDRSVYVEALFRVGAWPNRIRSQMEAFQPDVVVVAAEDPGQTVWQMATECGCRNLVVLVQTSWTLPFGPFSACSNEGNARLFKSASRILTISNYLQGYLREHGGVDSTVVRLPVLSKGPFSQFNNFSNGRIVMINPSAIKGISIFCSLMEANPQLPFGAVATWATTDADRQRMNAYPNFQELQPSENIDDILGQTRVMLVPSLWDEGFGYIATESLLRGVPTVASDVGGLPEAMAGSNFILPVRRIREYASAYSDRGYPEPIVPEQDVTEWNRVLRELTSTESLYRQVAADSRTKALAFVGQSDIHSIIQILDSATQSQPRVIADGARTGCKGEGTCECGSGERSSSSSDKADPRDADPTELALRILEQRKSKPAKASIVSQPRTGKVVSFPLSCQQTRMWFLWKLNPGSVAYNNADALWIEGQFDAERFRRTLRAIMRRHEILRTRFVEQRGEVTQEVLEDMPVPLEVVDLSRVNPSRYLDEARALGAEEASKPFDLAQAPLFRAKVLIFSPRKCLLLFTAHHIVSDGWSMGVLIHEFSRLYSQLNLGKPHALPPLSVQYGDYAIWQKEQVEGEGMRKQLGYWKERLEGAGARLRLPYRRQEPGPESEAGAKLSRPMGKETVERLKGLAQKQGASVYMLLLSALGVVLHAYTGQNDLCIGSPIANRNRRELEGLIGFFVNTLVMRLELKGEESFRELLGRVRQGALEAYEHQDLPFERLVQELSTDRQWGQSPLFEAMLVVQNAPMEELQVEGLRFVAEKFDHPAAKFNLTLFVSEQAGGWEMVWRFKAGLLEPALVEQMSQCLENLLAAVAENAELAVGSGIWVPAEQRQRWLGRPRRDEGPVKTVGELFERQVQARPEAMAAVCAGRQLSYRQVAEGAGRLARELLARGVRAEEPVGVMVPASLEGLMSLLGILASGAVYVPLESSYPPARLQQIIADAGIKKVITQGAQEIGRELEYVDWSQQEQWAASGPSHRSLDPGQLAYVLYTSGSTGAPKGVMVEHGALANHLLWRQEHCAVGAGQSQLQKAAWSFDIALWELLGPLVGGGRTVIVPPERRADSEYLVQLMGRERVSVAHSGPRLLQALLEQPGWAWGYPQHLFCGGEPLSRELARQYQERVGGRLYSQYGPTEATIDVTVCEYEDDPGRSMVPIGREIANTRVYVLNEQMELRPEGGVGEIYIGGKALARGYWQNPEATAQSYVPDPWGEAGARLYRTGDLGRRLSDGRLEYVGRRDGQVKVRGYRLELGEIEHALKQHPGVESCAVAVREGPSGPALVAYVVPRAGAGDGPAQWKQHLRNLLPDYMVPASYLSLEQLPLGATGKIDRKKLPSPDPDALSHATDFIQPKTGLEEALAGIWSQILGVSKVGALDNFFELGGHSLSATVLASRIRDQVNLDFPVRTVFERPMLRDLADAIEAAVHDNNSAKSIPLDVVDRSAPLALSYSQERSWILDQMDPGGVSHIIPLALRIRGPLATTALEQAINELLKRHEVLRTCFRLVDGRPLQIIEPHSDIRIKHVSLEQVPAEKQDSEVTQLAEKEAHTPFDLSAAPMVRAKLLKLADDHFVLLFTMHHVAGDGWSLAILAQEIQTMYAAFRKGEPSPLPDLKIQYADFSAWQRRWLAAGAEAQQLNYWKKQFAGDAPVLELPTDLPRPAVQSRAGAREYVRFDKKLTGALKEFSRKRGATLFMTLLAAFKTLLLRYTGQDDICVGTHVAGRNRTEVEGLIGFFLNQIVLRTDLSQNPPFTAFLEQVKAVTVAGYINCDVPLEKIINELKLKRDLSRAALYQVIFVLHNLPIQKLDNEDLEVSRFPFARHTANMDMHFSMIDDDGELVGTLEYCTDLFEADSMKRILEHYKALVCAILKEPDKRLSEFEILGVNERGLLLDQFSHRNGVTISKQTPVDGLEMRATTHPDRTAIEFGNRKISCGELNAACNQLVAALHEKLSPAIGKRVAVCLPAGPEAVIALLALSKAGCVCIPMNPTESSETLRAMLDNSGAVLVLACAQIAGKIQSGTRQVWELDSMKLLAANGGVPATRPGPAMETAGYLLYTVGPVPLRGVCVGNGRFVRFANAVVADFGLGDQDRIVQAASPGTEASIAETFIALAAGAVLVIPQGASTADCSLTTVLDRENISFAMLPPAVLSTISPDAVPGLKVLAIGCEAERRELIDAWSKNRVFYNSYGPLEAEIITRPAQHDSTPALWSNMGEPQHATVYVLDRCANVAPIGVPGEVFVGGESVAEGYLNQPDVTAERFVPDPFSKTPGARMCGTGDIGRIRRNGGVDYIGPVNGQARLRGERIDLSGIERAIRQNPSVRNVFVDVRGNGAEQKLCAYVEQRGVSDTADSSSGRQQVRDWRKLYEETYSQESSGSESASNFIGWNDSYTGKPIPQADMELWLQDTVESLSQLRSPRVLEIGCGTGLVLFKLEPSVQEYWGIDFSKTVIDQLNTAAKRAGIPSGKLKLSVGDAADLSRLPRNYFDLIVLNSVVQYFPNREYLLRVIAGCLDALTEKGKIFLGDIRSHALQDLMACSVEAGRADPGAPVRALKESIRTRRQQEPELLVDSKFFVALRNQFPQVGSVSVFPKRRELDNELFKYRYQVLVQKGDERDRSPTAFDRVVEWTNDAEVDALLGSSGQESVLVRHVPNPRLSADGALFERVSSADAGMDFAVLLRESPVCASRGRTLDDWQRVADGLGYHFQPSWLGHDGSGRYDLVFQKHSRSLAGAVERCVIGDALAQVKMDALTNEPSATRKSFDLSAELKDFLAGRLPERLVPSAVITLERLPQTPKGTIDRRALRDPVEDSVPKSGPPVGPRSPIEQGLQEIWGAVLNLENISVTDNFFEIGGHSLLATRVIARVRETFGIELPLKIIFTRAFTITELAATLLELDLARREDQEVKALLGEIESLSEDQAREALTASWS